MLHAEVILITGKVLCVFNQFTPSRRVIILLLSFHRFYDRLITFMKYICMVHTRAFQESTKAEKGLEPFFTTSELTISLTRKYYR